MRERLMAVLVGATIAVIALYGVPRAYFLSDLVEDQQVREVERSVDTVAAALSVLEDDDILVTESFLAATLGQDEAISYVSSDGSSTRAGDQSLASGDSGIVRSRPVAGGGRVTLSRAGDVVDQRVADALLPLVLIGLGLVATSALVGFFLARRLSRPFQELAVVATSLGKGRFDQVVPHYTVPEAEAIADALRTSSAQLDGLVRREREFSVNASHELMTPITALGLQLEDLKEWPEAPPAVVEELQASLETVERLAATVREMLAHHRSTLRTTTLDVDLTTLTEHAVKRWRPTLAAARREIRLESPGVIPARLVLDDVDRVLDLLIDNACRHGRGTLVVDCADLGTHLRVRVGDEGRRGGQSNVMHREGHGAGTAASGLETAAELAEAQGGYLLLDDSPTTRFVLMLPKSSPSTDRPYPPERCDSVVS